MYQQFFAIEKKLKGHGYNLERQDIVHTFTGGAKTSLKALTPHEYKELVNWMNSELSKLSKPTKLTLDSNQKQRKKIIAVLCKVGMIKNGKADMDRIYAWVMSHGYLHKHLNQYTAAELPKLVYQANEFYKSHLKAL